MVGYGAAFGYPQKLRIKSRRIGFTRLWSSDQGGADLRLAIGTALAPKVRIVVLQSGFSMTRF
jgi:hypothetical protein